MEITATWFLANWEMLVVIVALGVVWVGVDQRLRHLAKASDVHVEMMRELALRIYKEQLFQQQLANRVINGKQIEPDWDKEVEEARREWEQFGLLPDRLEPLLSLDQLNSILKRHGFKPPLPASFRNTKAGKDEVETGPSSLSAKSAASSAPHAPRPLNSTNHADHIDNNLSAPEPITSEEAEKIRPALILLYATELGQSFEVADENASQTLVLAQKGGIELPEKIGGLLYYFRECGHLEPGSMH